MTSEQPLLQSTVNHIWHSDTMNHRQTGVLQRRCKAHDLIQVRFCLFFNLWENRTFQIHFKTMMSASTDFPHKFSMRSLFAVGFSNLLNIALADREVRHKADNFFALSNFFAIDGSRQVPIKSLTFCFHPAGSKTRNVQQIFTKNQS